MEKVLGSSTDESSDEEEIKRHKKKSKKEKHKKHKSKDKKRKKRKHRRRSSTSEDSDGASEEEWVTKDSGPSGQTSECKSEGPKQSLEPVETRNRDNDAEWMNFDTVIPTYSNNSKKMKRQEEREKQRKPDALGQTSMELNPYWKDGGTGLPSAEDPEKAKEKMSATTVIGDGGLSWLKKSYQRAKEQAAEEGKSLEEIAAIRWGSLENFFFMLEEAESKAKSLASSSRNRDNRENSSSSSLRRNRFKRPGNESGDSEDDRRDDRRSSHSNYRYRSSREQRKSDCTPSWRKNTEKRSHMLQDDSSRYAERDDLLESRSPKRQKSKSRSLSPLTSTTERTNPKHEKYESKKINVDNKVDLESEEVCQPKVLSDKEMNELGSKILKAELMGNQELVIELKAKFDVSEKIRQDFIKNGGTPGKNPTETKVITKVIMDSGNSGRGRRIKDKITETHKDGQRVRYFPDDDKQTLKNMFQREKLNTVEDENALFSRLAGKGVKADSEYDMDDVFADRASSSKRQYKDQEREVKKVIEDEKEYQKTLDDCNWCFDGKHLQKNLVISIGEKCYVCVPPFQSLTEGHCLIVPMFHTPCSTFLDEDVWMEMKKFRQALVKMYSDKDEDAVIIETAVSLKRSPHMYLECIPMPKETGELAPIYFKKAIQECETEWSQNKKLVDLRDRDVRRAVPKGLPYFSVDFGLDSGFAHVIEDERNFPKNFAQEIVGGMLELDHHLWRKQKTDDFKTQRAKVMTFLKMWAPYDFTKAN